MCRIVWLGLICLSMCLSVVAQTPPAENLAPLLQEFRVALANDRLSAAAELADRLENGVRAKYDAWLIRDARERTQEILGWLPVDMEALWINQEPFVIDPQQSMELLHFHPTQAYSMDRLMALNGGDIYRALANRTVRLAGGAARRIGEPSMGIPGPVAANVAYFYFFDSPVSLPPPTEQIEGHPAWRATATVDTGAPFGPGFKRETREDVNWLVLVKPNVLILANSRELTGQILARMAGAGKGRALPDSLPEWQHVSRDASFWALRHFIAAKAISQPDGITVAFHSAERQLELQYLGSASPTAAKWEISDGEFQIEHLEPGRWRLVSDIKARGPFPFHFAMSKLGFGVYR